VPSRMVNVSASVNLPLHRKVQKFSSGTGSPGWCGGGGGCALSSGKSSVGLGLNFGFKFM